jgi:hypothetical protein
VHPDERVAVDRPPGADGDEHRAVLVVENVPDEPGESSSVGLPAEVLGQRRAVVLEGRQGHAASLRVVGGSCGPSAGSRTERARRGGRGVLPQWPELPGLECQSLRGADDVPRRVASRRATVMASSPAGLMSA